MEREEECPILADDDFACPILADDPSGSSAELLPTESLTPVERAGPNGNLHTAETANTDFGSTDIAFGDGSVRPSDAYVASDFFLV